MGDKISIGAAPVCFPLLSDLLRMSSFLRSTKWLSIGHTCHIYRIHSGAFTPFVIPVVTYA